jgi:hypothetical protein
LQYFPHLPVANNPQAMVSYNKSVAQIREISTSAASLESTSLVFAYGLDMYYVRVMPAKSFDLLPTDFNYELLILLVLGLGVATLVMRGAVSRKKLNDAWK